MASSSALDMPGTHVLLIGGSAHVEGSALPSVPAVGRSVDALRQTLVEQCGVDAAHVRVLHDPADPGQLGSAITEAANQAESVLLVYYVGHGLIGPMDGQLYLGTYSTDDLIEGLAYKALPYSAVREALARSRARLMVVVLDCCFSGRADGAYGAAAADAFAASAVRGTHVLTSAAADESALAPPGDEYTAFTGQLLRLLHEGDPTRPESLTLLDAYEWLDRTLPAHGAPRPRQHASDTSGQLVLARNPAFTPVTSTPAEPPADVPCPYRGMDRYDAQDAHYFFGREDAIDDVLRLIAVGTGPFMVVGPSGSGKSSLLHAGLIPALERGALPGSAGWRCRVMTPGEQPTATLERTLRGADDRTRTILIVDQLEELFTACADEDERVAFLHQLSTTGDHVRVVLGLRADFFGRCMTYPELVAVLRDSTYLMVPMTDVELRDVIEKPAREVGLALEPGLTDLILRDLRAGHAEFDVAGALPLLSYALLTTWQRRAGTTMTLAGYQAGGGIWESVSRRAEATYSALSPAAQDVARRTLLRMVHISADADHTRRRARTAELTGRADATTVAQVLDAFARDRLTMADNETVTITHESLLRAWPRLRQWIERDSADLVIHQQISDAAERWAQLGRDDGGLYRGRALTEAELWREARDNERELSPLDRQFLDASSAERRAAAEEAERRHAGERRQNSRLRLLTLGLSVLVVVALAASGIAGLQTRSAQAQRGTAQEQQHIATARLLVSQAEAARATDPNLALQLGIAAQRIHPDPQTGASLVGTLTGTRYAGRISGLSRQATVSYAPAGHLLATGHTVRTRVAVDQSASVGLGTEAGPSGPSASAPSASASPTYITTFQAAITLWTVPGAGAPRRMGAPILIDNADRSFVVFAPDRQILLTSDDDNNAVVFWDVSDPARPSRLGTLDAGQHVTISAVAYSRDGRQLATVEDDSLALWDVGDPAHPRRLGTQPTARERVSSVAFSSDGRLIATGDDEGVVLWDVGDPTHPHQVGVPLAARNPVTFSPSSPVLATHDKSDEDANAFVLWDVDQPDSPRRLGTMGGNNEGMAFSPDGQTVATTGFGGTSTLWDVTDPAAPVRTGDPLVGHTGFVGTATFSPDGTSLGTASSDESVILWNLTDVGRPAQTGEPVAHVDALVLPADGRALVAGGDGHLVSLRELEGGTKQRTLAQDVPGGWATISPDGRLLATPASDGSMTLWDISEPTQPVRISTTPPGSGAPVMFSPDNRLLITGDEDTSYLWDVSDPRHPVRRVDTLPAVIVLAAAFSPDGRTLAVANIYDRAATLWNVSDPKHPTERPTTLPVEAFTNVTGLAFSPDSSTLATGRADGTIALWNVSRPEKPTRVGQLLIGPSDVHGNGGAVNSDVSVSALSFSPDGRILATTHLAAGLILWDVTDVNAPTQFGPPVPLSTRPAFQVLFSPTGRTVATIGVDHKATLWDVSGVVDLQRHAAQTACTITGKGLDATAWKTYASGLPYQDTCA
ncbi:WD40 repeat domain-containing protein [Cellulomonas sp. URHD0024]|uniref:WD40 repeat domain-containing protein n=1 Tax=Cellulomonas sp. URHD0024 TaxID=1302620 RepID=UPI00040FA9C2|nr:WD40 repeat domain-containing protein [Cellulomonas sp. URHD0024]